MPELPEVQTIANQLQRRLVGQKLAGVVCSREKTCLPNPLALKVVLTGKILRQVYRLGKYLVFAFSDDRFLIIHLRVSGRLFLKKATSKPSRWERVRFIFDNQTALVFDNLRAFGRVELADRQAVDKLRGSLGTDALLISPEEFYSKIKNRRLAIKQALLNQKILSGVGNIYANEALFLARIHPAKQCRLLTDKDASVLVEAVRKVLSRGLKLGGATLADEMFRDIFNHRGRYSRRVLVYAREGEPCPNNCGGVVRKIKLGGRGTYFCPRCQKG